MTMEISDETYFRMVSASRSAVQFSKLASDLVAPHELLELPRIEAMLMKIKAIQLVAMPSPADEKPKPKTPAPKPSRRKVSDGAKALAAFNHTAAKRKRRAPRPTKPRGRQ